MEEEKYVKIIKPWNKNNVWYNDFIGKIFKCELSKPKNNLIIYKVLDNPKDYEDRILFISNDVGEEVSKEEYDTQNNNYGFTLNKWYKFTDKLYCKVNKIIPKTDYNQIWYYEKIDLFEYNSYSKVSNYIANPDYANHALEYNLHLDEIQKYLPDGHIDKYIKPKPNKELEMILNDILNQM